MRIVSLVPSLTLTLFDLGCSVEEVVGRTPWCIHPTEKVEHVAVVGGTKTPNINKILATNPDLVVLDREENPKAVYDSLIKAGIDVFVIQIHVYLNRTIECPLKRRCIQRLQSSQTKSCKVAGNTPHAKAISPVWSNSNFYYWITKTHDIDCACTNDGVIRKLNNTLMFVA